MEHFGRGDRGVEDRKSTFLDPESSTLVLQVLHLYMCMCMCMCMYPYMHMYMYMYMYMSCTCTCSTTHTGYELRAPAIPRANI